MELVSSFEALVRELSCLMTRPTFDSFLIIVTGWLFATHRTVTGIIQAAGAVAIKHFSSFHRFFADARWSLDELGLAVLRLALAHLDPDATVCLAHKCDRKVFGAAVHHDPAISSGGSLPAGRDG